MRKKSRNEPWWLGAAWTHQEADGVCGREWVCGCGACRVGRTEAPRMVPKMLGPTAEGQIRCLAVFARAAARGRKAARERKAGAT